jgi:hypothetical protein
MSNSVLLGLKAGEDFTYHEHENGLKYHRHDYFDIHDDLEACPQSYLIKQLPNITNPLHFHMQNQFQVFIVGSGSFGRHEVLPYVVHYAGAYTGYGPIIAGDQGLQYLTLRCSRDLGAKFLPAQMKFFKKGPKHHYTSPSILPEEKQKLNQLNEVLMDWVHYEEKSHLGIGVLKIPPHTEYPISLLQDVAGLFLVVMEGLVFANQQKLVKNENLYIPEGHNTYTVCTADCGVQILFLQMPKRDQAYTSAS